MQFRSIAITTEADGSATAYCEVVSGRLLAVVYTKSDFDNGVDFTITGERYGQAILTLTDRNTSGVFYPRSQVHGPTGTGLVFAAAGEIVADTIPLWEDRVKIVIAQGGNVKTGTISILVD